MIRNITQYNKQLKYNKSHNITNNITTIIFYYRDKLQIIFLVDNTSIHCIQQILFLCTSLETFFFLYLFLTQNYSRLLLILI